MGGGVAEAPLPLLTSVPEASLEAGGDVMTHGVVGGEGGGCHSLPECSEKAETLRQ